MASITIDAGGGTPEARTRASSSESACSIKACSSVNVNPYCDLRSSRSVFIAARPELAFAWTGDPRRPAGRPTCDLSLVTWHEIQPDTDPKFKGGEPLFTSAKCRKLLAFSMVVAAVSLIPGTASASTIKDPRKCSTVTPGGIAKHAYWCAHNAAVTAVRTKMAARQHVTHWYAPTFCDQGATLLAWKCSTLLGGSRWSASVRWRATSSGWHLYTTVVAAP